MAKCIIKNSKKVSTVTTIHRMAVVIGVLSVLAFSGCFDSSTEDPAPSLKPPPLKAVDDEVNTPVDTAIDISVLDNDSDASGVTLSISSFDDPATQGGSVVDNGDGTLKYTPPAAFEGIDTFTYTITDPGNDTDTAIVKVLVGNATLVSGRSYYKDNCAICHAAGADDTTTAFSASDLGLQTIPLATDLSIYGGSYELMGAFANVPQQTIDDLNEYFSSL